MPKLPIMDGQIESARRAGNLTSRSELSPEQAGAGIGRALGNFGNALGDLGATIFQKQQQKFNTEAQINVANLTRDAQIKLTDLANSSPPDGAGVTDGFSSWMDDQWAKLEATATTPDQKRYYAERRAALGAEFIPRANNFEAGKSADYAKTQTNDAIDGVYSSIIRDPSMFDTLYKQGADIIDKHYALRAEDKAALKTTFSQNAAKAYFSTVIDGATTQDQTGQLRKQLNDKNNPIAKLLDPTTLAAELGRVDAQEKAIVTGVTAQVQADAEAAMAQLKAGAKVDPATLAKIHQDVLAHGSPKLVHDWTEQLNVSQFADGLRGASKAELEQLANAGKDSPAPTGGAADVIRAEEGYRAGAYWDVNAYRTGYGSDTITRADGSIERVKPGTVITRADAERDLNRRIGEFAAAAAVDVGQDVWNKLPENAKAGMISVAYNYGSLPKSVVNAARTGNPSAIAAAVANLSANPERRKREAAIINGGALPTGGNADYYRSTAAQQVLNTYTNGMKADPTKFVMNYVPQFFPNGGAVDLTNGQGLSDRMKGIQASRDYLNNPDIPLLSHDEVDQLTTQIDNMNAQQRVAFAATVQQNLGSSSDELWKQLKEKNPDMAFAGLMLTHSPSSLGTAYDLIRAEDARKAYQDTAAGAKFIKDMGDTSRLDPNIAATLGRAPIRIDEITHAADSLYLLRNGVSGEFDQSKYNKIVSEVMGGWHAENVHGAPVLLPPGIDGNTMQTALDKMTDPQVAQLSASGGTPVYQGVDHTGATVTKPITADDIATEGQLEAYGPDVYAVRMANDGGYALDSSKVAQGASLQDSIFLMHMPADTIKQIAAQPDTGNPMEQFLPDSAPRPAAPVEGSSISPQPDTTPAADNNPLAQFLPMDQAAQPTGAVPPAPAGNDSALPMAIPSAEDIANTTGAAGDTADPQQAPLHFQDGTRYDAWQYPATGVTVTVADQMAGLGGAAKPETPTGVTLGADGKATGGNTSATIRKLLANLLPSLNVDDKLIATYSAAAEAAAREIAGTTGKKDIPLDAVLASDEFKKQLVTSNQGHGASLGAEIGAQLAAPGREKRGAKTGVTLGPDGAAVTGNTEQAIAALFAQRFPKLKVSPDMITAYTDMAEAAAYEILKKSNADSVPLETVLNSREFRSQFELGQPQGSDPGHDIVIPRDAGAGPTSINRGTRANPFRAAGRKLIATWVTSAYPDLTPRNAALVSTGIIKIGRRLVRRDPNLVVTTDVVMASPEFQRYAKRHKLTDLIK